MKHAYTRQSNAISKAQANRHTSRNNQCNPDMQCSNTGTCTCRNFTAEKCLCFGIKTNSFWTSVQSMWLWLCYRTACTSRACTCKGRAGTRRTPCWLRPSPCSSSAPFPPSTSNPLRPRKRAARVRERAWQLVFKGNVGNLHDILNTVLGHRCSQNHSRKVCI